MPLPENFNEFEHLQDTIRRDYNKAVKQYFKNQPDDDLSTPAIIHRHLWTGFLPWMSWGIADLLNKPWEPDLKKWGPVLFKQS